MRLNPLIIIILLQACTPVTQSSVNSPSNPKVLQYTDYTYEYEIRTVQLHPGPPSPQAALQPAVTAMGQWNLVLEFDDLTTQRDYYYAKIIHCNFDWTKSTLMDLDFMTEYNELPLNNYEFSANTHIPYVHYWLQLPPVKLPGNYLVIVYRGSNKEDLILSKRFMVHDRQMVIAGERNLVGAGNIARINQQLNFTVNYKNLDIINPLENVKVVVRQNQRLDNLSQDIRPSFVREIEKQIEYRFFDDEKMFKGGNEFRFFDMRSLLSPGRNVAKVDKTVKPYEVYVQPDKSRADEVYGQYLDMNGAYILDNFDFSGATTSNYVYVNFLLQAKKPVKGNVFVNGAFHQWKFDQDNVMTYDSVKREYYGRILLKQGWYDYQYVVHSEEVPTYFFEGSHFETENNYEIFVYYRSFNPRADLLLGYQPVGKNTR